MQRYKTSSICRVLEVSRSNQYQHRHPRPKRYHRAEDALVLSEILQVTSDRGTYGYRRTTALINRARRLESQAPVNWKRVLRVMQINRLVLGKSGTRKERLHLGQVITMRSNLRYCSDIFEIKCWDGGKVRVAFSLDCHDREAMSFVSHSRPLSHRDIILLMDQTVTHRFGETREKLPHPIQWLSDQGSQYTALETKLYGHEWGFEVVTTPAYSPESNGMAEAFVKLFKRDYVYANELWTTDSVLRRLPEWFRDYNQNHPHSGLKYQSPLEYRKATKSQTQLSV